MIKYISKDTKNGNTCKPKFFSSDSTIEPKSVIRK